MEWSERGVKCPSHFTIWHDDGTRIGKGGTSGLYYRPGKKAIFKPRGAKLKLQRQSKP